MVLLEGALLAKFLQAAAIQIFIIPSPETFALYGGLYLYIKGNSAALAVRHAADTRLLARSVRRA
jgi:hypothetical protein